MLGKGMLSKLSFSVSLLLILALIMPVMPSYADDCEKLIIFCPPPPTDDPVCPDPGDDDLVTLYRSSYAASVTAEVYDGEECPPPTEDPTEDDITVVPVCTDEEGKRKWIFRNKHNEPIKIGWGIEGSDERGELEIPGKPAGAEYGEIVLYTDAVEEGNVLYFYDGFTIKGEVEGIDETCLPPPEEPPEDSLTVVPVCTDEEGKRKWIFRNTHDQPIKINWGISGSDQGGELEIPGKPAGAEYAEMVLYTDAVEEGDILYYSDGLTISNEVEGIEETCLPPPPSNGGGSSSDDHDDGDSSTDQGRDEDSDGSPEPISDEVIETEEDEEYVETDFNLFEPEEEQELIIQEEPVEEELVQIEPSHQSTLSPTEGGKLPKTSVPWYNLFLISLVALLSSGIWLWRQRNQPS